MADISIYHNPSCSKSRQVLQLLRDRGLDPTIVEYLKQPPTEQQITRLLNLLVMEPRDLIRKNEAEYISLGLDDPKLVPIALIKAMARYPVLIERPIVVRGDRAVLGRPPEKVLEIL
jgi:arsenate reductase (glutaredoxin)